MIQLFRERATVVKKFPKGGESCIGYRLVRRATVRSVNGGERLIVRLFAFVSHMIATRRVQKGSVRPSEPGDNPCRRGGAAHARGAAGTTLRNGSCQAQRRVFKVALPVTASPTCYTTEQLMAHMILADGSRIEQLEPVVRRLAAIVIMQPELDANYEAIRDAAYEWPKSASR